MAINKGLFTSKTDQWETPQDFFDKLNTEFSFELDVCALPNNHKCEKYFSPDDNGLEQEWTGTCWMNPPYGKNIAQWVKKAYEEGQKGSTVVCLLPGRVDTRWFHDYCMKGEIRIVKGRLKFGGSEWNAPFPNIVVIFGPRAKVGSFSAIA